MKGFKLTLCALLSLGFVCVINGNSIQRESSLNEEKKDAGEKTATVSTTSTMSTTSTTTTTTSSEKTETEKPNPNSACGGLKGFLHLCEHVKEEESPKQTRSVSWDGNTRMEENDSDESVENSSEDQEPQIDPVRYEPLHLAETAVKKRSSSDSDESSESSSEESKSNQSSEFSQRPYDATALTETSKNNEKPIDSSMNYQEEFSSKPFESESHSDES